VQKHILMKYFIILLRMKYQKNIKFFPVLLFQIKSRLFLGKKSKSEKGTNLSVNLMLFISSYTRITDEIESKLEQGCYNV
jgi:hypothetical protein